jgi:hypothetical protein
MDPNNRRPTRHGVMLGSEFLRPVNYFKTRMNNDQFYAYLQALSISEYIAYLHECFNKRRHIFLCAPTAVCPFECIITFIRFVPATKNGINRWKPFDWFRPRWVTLICAWPHGHLPNPHPPNQHPPSYYYQLNSSQPNPSQSNPSQQLYPSQPWSSLLAPTKSLLSSKPPATVSRLRLFSIHPLIHHHQDQEPPKVHPSASSGVFLCVPEKQKMETTNYQSMLLDVSEQDKWSEALNAVKLHLGRNLIYIYSMAVDGGQYQAIYHCSKVDKNGVPTNRCIANQNNTDCRSWRPPHELDMPCWCQIPILAQALASTWVAGACFHGWVCLDGQISWGDNLF